MPIDKRLDTCSKELLMSLGQYQCPGACQSDLSNRLSGHSHGCTRSCDLLSIYCFATYKVIANLPVLFRIHIRQNPEMAQIQVLIFSKTARACEIRTPRRSCKDRMLAITLHTPLQPFEIQRSLIVCFYYQIEVFTVGLEPTTSCMSRKHSSTELCELQSVCN